MRLLRVLVGALLVGALFTVGALVGVALAARASVSLTPSGPEPQTVTIDWGDTVAFSNADTVERTVTSERAELNSGPIAPGGTFEHRYTGRTGSYRFLQLGTRPTTFGVVVLETKGRVTLTTPRETILYGSLLAFGGRSSYPGTPVDIQFRPAGASGDWTSLVQVTAAENGTYSGRRRMTTGGRLRAVVAAGQVRSQLVDLTLLPRLQMRVSSRTGAEGRRLVVTGRVVPAGGAVSVDLEERRAGPSNWQRKATANVSKRGTVTFVTKATGGRNFLRLVVKRGGVAPGFGPTTSRAILVVGN